MCIYFYYVIFYAKMITIDRDEPNITLMVGDEYDEVKRERGADWCMGTG